MEQCEEVGHDAFHLVGDEYLIAIELNLVALQFDVRLDTWEVEDTRKVERIVNVEVYPEQWFVLHRIERAVERFVVLVLQCAWSLCPQGLHIIYYIVLVGLHVLAVLPFGLLAECHRHRHKLAIFVEQALDSILLKELLAVVVDVQHDVSSAALSFGIVNLVCR